MWEMWEIDDGVWERMRRQFRRRGLGDEHWFNEVWESFETRAQPMHAPTPKAAPPSTPQPVNDAQEQIAIVDSLEIEESHLHLLPEEIRVAMLRNKIILTLGKGDDEELGRVRDTLDDNCTSLWCACDPTEDGQFWIMFETDADKMKFKLALKR